MSDQDGQATAVSIVVAIRRFGARWYSVLFAVARRVAWVTDAMRRQQFIHFCHWMILREVPTADGGTRRLDRPVLWFESNYDGEVMRYMDTFARIMPWRMRAAWTPTADFPDMFPSGPFHEWTFDNAYENAHYWSAYPQATTRDVGRAWRVREAAAALPAGDEAMTAEEFGDSWRRFLATCQADL